MGALHRLTIIAGYLLIILAIVLGVFEVVGFPVGGNEIGALALLTACAALVVWISRKLFVEVKKRKIPDYDIAKNTLLYLRKHHILFGWATIVAASSHGVFYLLRYPNRLGEIISGMIALVLLFALGTLGSFVDYRIQMKKKAQKIRLYHFVLAILFMCVLLIHVL